MTAALKSIACTVLSAAIAIPAAADDGPEHRVKQMGSVKMGTSGGSKDDRSTLYCCGGTLGSLVRYGGADHILSNNHVLGRSGLASAGEDTVQPALIDTGCNAGSSNIVGDYAGNIVPLGTANVDAAISVAHSNVDATGAIINIGVPCSATQVPTVGLAVQKSGRTTGHTTGTVQAINVSVTIQYQKGCNKGKKFNVSYTNQVSISDGSFSAGGDSGSLILSTGSTPNPTALLYAGSSSVTIGNPISDVVAAFGPTFSFVGSACSALVAEGEVPGAPGAAEVQRVRLIKEQREAELFQLPGVAAVGVGAGDTPGEAAIVVYVESPGGSLPAYLPDRLDGVAVKVFPTDPIVPR